MDAFEDQLAVLRDKAKSLYQRGLFKESLDAHNEALRLAPDAVVIRLSAAKLAHSLELQEVSLGHFEEAARLDPRCYQAVESARRICVGAGFEDRALHYSRLAYDLNPAADALVSQKLLVPSIMDSTDAIRETRARYERGVDEMAASTLRLETPEGAVGVSAFFLAYHGENDRDLQVKTAQLFRRTIPSLQFTAPHCVRARRGAAKIRIGFISRFFASHSIYSTSVGLIEKLSREKFEVIVLRIMPSRDDADTARIRAAADHTVTLDPDIYRAREQIAALELDILFYQDIGMEPISYFLAFARLAPVQCVSFGHPNTTGIPTMDYFISNDLFEPPDAQAHYSETLVQLRDLPTLAYYYKPKVPANCAARESFGLPADATLYVCPQTLYKLHPDFDGILRGILERDARALVILIAGQFREFTDRLRARFARSMPSQAPRIVFLPFMAFDRFMQLLCLADVVLDTVHFNGMNSSLQAFAAGTPVVTLPGRLQRGRHTLAMYRKMGIEDCIAADSREYIDIAVRVASDRAYAEVVRRRILARNHVLFEDIRVVQEFERFFVDALAAMQPQNAEAWFLRGNTLQLGGAYEEAVGSYERALRVRPDFPAALNNLGHSLRMLRRIQQALAIFARALALQPDYAMALNNQGLALLDLQRVPEALRSFDEALEVQPAFAEALSNRGAALLAAKRFAEAAETFEHLVAIAPHLGGARGSLLYARRHCCDWRTYEPLAEGITAAVQRGEFADVPLSFMGVADSPHTHLACARTFSAARYPSPASVKACVPHAHDKIRVAYLSGDFGEHAVSYLLAGVIARHDTRRFDTIAVGWGRQNDGPTRARLEAAFGRFIDATHTSDAEVAMQLRDLEVDIAIDLTGHTGGQRTGIFALRSAPLQVNYLGYPGTSGAPYMDYIIADSIVIPRAEERAYSECVARLPNCYLPNDDRRSIGPETLTRGAAGLPESGFVFCAFNNPVKITPAVFSVWMELLRQVPESVLWLRAGVTEARRNLERAAEERGIAPSRLVFAASVDSIESHLARHRLADLFLDTLPYNGHTTACDALWAGLPVLTCSGRSFASRVGESVLRAMALPELITHSLPGYAQAALELARNPSRLGGIRERLAQNRRTSALFDTARYCRHLEAAYVQMWERQRAGLSPASFAVDAGLA